MKYNKVNMQSVEKKKIFAKYHDQKLLLCGITCKPQQPTAFIMEAL